jgi:hypothetical protein
VTDHLFGQFEHWKVTYARILARMRSGMPFALSRWNDGEWPPVLRCEPKWRDQVQKVRSVSCGKHLLPETMCLALRDVLLNRPRYLLGISPHTFRVMGDAVRGFVDEHRLRDLDWVNADVLHGASRDGMLGEFVQAVTSFQSCLVGPAHLSPVAQTLRVSEHVVIPERDCWAAVETILKEVTAAAQRTTLILVSAGPPAKWLIHQLAAQFGRTHFILDTGSLWDVFAGVKSRLYHANVDTKQLGG